MNILTWNRQHELRDSLDILFTHDFQLAHINSESSQMCTKYSDFVYKRSRHSIRLLHSMDVAHTFELFSRTESLRRRLCETESTEYIYSMVSMREAFLDVYLWL